jgi:molybdopterin molybdotransferase
VGTAHPTERQCEDNGTLVFGLPGNPVSSLVCFELFVRPAIQKMRGLAPTGLRRATAKLTSEHQQRGDRPTYWPSVLDGEGVKPLSWKGSGDLRTLTEANCLAVFAAGEQVFRDGEEVSVLLLEE